jgi:protein KRI1
MKFQINHTFAREYERRKRREELAKLREHEQHTPRGSNQRHPPPEGGEGTSSAIDSANVDASESDEESTEEDEMGVLLTKRLDAQWARTLELIRRRDARIYDPNFRFYEEEESSGTDSESSSKTASSDTDEPVAGYDYLALHAEKETAVYLDQYAREALVQHSKAKSSSASGSVTSGSETDSVDGAPSAAGNSCHVAVYDAEQAEIRQAFLEQAERETRGPNTKSSDRDTNVLTESGDQSSDELFTIKIRDRRLEEILAAHTATAPPKSQRVEDALALDNEAKSDEDLLHSYLEKETAEEKEAFLYDYLVHNRWLGPVHAALEKAASTGEEQESTPIDPIEQDEAFLEKQDQFEYEHNFRFEEPDADVIPSHPRQVQGSLRRPSSKQEARKRQREAKMAREEAEKRQRLETLRRLRNARHAERVERMKRLARAAGLRGEAAMLSSPEGSTTERAWLERMVSLAESDTDFDASHFDATMRAIFDREEYQNAPDDGWEPTPTATPAGDRTECQIGPHQRLRGHATDLTERVDDVNSEGSDSELDALYREDLLADTRFHYRRVEPRSFGLTAEEMLAMDERTLNAYASIKYIQPFREAETLPKRLRKLLRGNTSMQRYRLKQARHHTGSNDATPRDGRKRADPARSSRTVTDPALP